MRKVKLYVETGFVSCKHEEVVEVEDDITDEELDEMVQDFKNDCISCGWYDVEDEESED